MPILDLKPQWELGQLPKTREKRLPSNDRGNLETVRVMREVARFRASHPLVRELSLKILERDGVDSHDFLKEAECLARFVQKEVRYVRDIDGVEQLHDPVLMIQNISKGTAQGDCDDMALLLATMLLSVGHSPFFAIVRYNETSGPYNHIYVVVYEKNWRGPRKRLVMDTIVKDRPIGFEVPHVSRKEIKI
jgi:hypothetical protein